MINEDIIKISILKKCNIANLHNGAVFRSRDIIKVSFKNGINHYIDTYSGRDLYNIDYIKVVLPDAVKEKVLFEEINEI